MSLSAIDWILLAAVGGAGAVLRLRLDGAVEGRLGGVFPFGTLGINLLGSLVLGVLTGAGVATATMFVAGTGFLGSFTTFSTWMFETQRLGEDGELAAAGANLGVSVVLGLAAGAVGWVLGALL